MVRGYVSAILCLSLFFAHSQAVNFDSCLHNVTQGIYGPIGLNSAGHPVNASDATAISYKDCVKYCGIGPEPLQWAAFFKRFSSWLLPWLALVSQIPFGTGDRLWNLEAMLLTVGSPTLGAYSLALTVLNVRWIAGLFRAQRYSNVRNVVRVLSSLQQAPLRINEDKALLAYLIVLPENDEWWNELITWADYSHSWTISAAASIAWVAIAYAFTVVESFSDINDTYLTMGEGVGALWLWLIPIVVGWLQLSPKCDSARLRRAVERANGVAYVLNDTDVVVPAASVSDQRAIYLDFSMGHNTLRVDEQSTAPIYNYARHLPWTEAVCTVFEAYSEVSRNAGRHVPVNQSQVTAWVEAERGRIVSKHNRRGNHVEILQYCGFMSIEENSPSKSRKRLHALSRMLLASGLALFLQWGTTGAATVIAWFTPTRGLGCRSSSYLAYGVLSTVVWILLVTSSILSYWARTFNDNGAQGNGSKRNAGRVCRGTVMGTLAILLRRAGKLIASVNAIWIVVSCMFHFTNFYDTCYCNSSVLGLRSHAYNVMYLEKGDASKMRSGWSGGIGLAGGTVLIFIFFINILINPVLPE